MNPKKELNPRILPPAQSGETQKYNTFFRCTTYMEFSDHEDHNQKIQKKSEHCVTWMVIHRKKNVPKQVRDSTQSGVCTQIRHIYGCPQCSCKSLKGLILYHVPTFKEDWHLSSSFYYVSTICMEEQPTWFPTNLGLMCNI